MRLAWWLWKTAGRLQCSKWEGRVVGDEIREAMKITPYSEYERKPLESFGRRVACLINALNRSFPWISIILSHTLEFFILCHFYSVLFLFAYSCFIKFSCIMSFNIFFCFAICVFQVYQLCKCWISLFSFLYWLFAP